MGTRSVEFETADGHRLEGRLGTPEEVRGGAILCHPHPLYGGTMSSAIIPAVQRALAALGWASLRFNFRGVGKSEGTFGRGIGEVKDATAALEVITAEVGDRPLAVVGWSFGSLVGLTAAVAEPRVRTYVGIAPPVTVRHNTALPVLPPRENIASWGGRILIVCGTEDDFCATTDLAGWAEELPGSPVVKMYDGEDHFFSKDKHSMAADVAAFVAGA